MLLVIKSMSNELVKVTAKIALMNIVIAPFAIYYYGYYGLAWTVVMVQILNAYLLIKANKKDGLFV